MVTRSFVWIGAAAVTLFLALFIFLANYPVRNDPLPATFQRILAQADRAVLFSLEPQTPPNAPGTRLHNFEILGQTTLDPVETHVAASEFESATNKSSADFYQCFDPRHALRIVSNGHTYDFLLCYSCHSLEVYQDDKMVTGANAEGSPVLLNELLRKHHIPLSNSGGSDR
jgi:hypothetical protein